VASYVRRSLVTIVRIFIVYSPLRFFTACAAIVAIPGAVMVARFLYNYMIGHGSGNIQSLVLSSALLALAGILAMGGILAELIAVNRQLLEEIRIRQLRQELRSLPQAGIDDQPVETSDEAKKKAKARG
jgi:hypothetical protein